METASKQCHSPLPVRIREHVYTEGDLNVERALRITRAASFEIPMNLVFQVCDIVGKRHKRFIK